MIKLEPENTANKTEIHLDEKPYVRIGMFVLLVTFVIMLGWASIAPLNSAVIASGRITVASENKVVQHLDGGQVKTILVRDGDIVEQGQVLLSLNDESLHIRLKQIHEQALETQANLYRLAAERDKQTELTMPDSLTQKVSSAASRKILETQQQLFASRKQTLGSELDVLTQRSLQLQKQLEGSNKLVKTLKHRLVLLTDRQKALKELVTKGVVSKQEVRDNENNIVSLQGEIYTQKGEISRLKESLSEIKHSRILREREFQQEVITQLRDLQSQQIDLQAQEKDILEQLRRIDIRAPIAGKIKGLNVVTEGAVISAAQAIMEIVPLDKEFKIDAKVSPMDIDSLYTGLNAEVRVAAFEGSQNFDSLHANLMDVSTDVYQSDQSDEAYYKATLMMNETSLETLNEEKRQLVSGMPVDVIIKTGERTLASYLMQPFSEMLARAFNES